MNPKVSIIVPVYNVGKYLQKCLNSISNQSYPNLEIIIVNDGSTDNSKIIAESFTKKDRRFTLINQPNSGQSSARNAGLKKATGEYISFIDGDDYVCTDFISHLLAPFLISQSKKPVLSVCGIHYKRLKKNTASNVYINPVRSIRPGESFKAYILRLLTIDGRMYSSVNKLYIAKTAKKLQFDTKLNFAEDTKFVLDYLKKTPGQISFILEPLYTYNFGTDTSTISSTATSWKNWQISYDNLKTWLGPNPKIKEQVLLHLVRLRWRISYVRSKYRFKS